MAHSHIYQLQQQLRDIATDIPDRKKQSRSYVNMDFAILEAQKTLLRFIEYYPKERTDAATYFHSWLEQMENLVIERDHNSR